MEHITVKNLGNGMVKLTPDNGYMLMDVRTRRMYSEAVTETPENFIAVTLNRNNAQ